MNKPKCYAVSKQVVWDAWLQVKRNKGAAGVDGMTIEKYELNLKDNLYKLWNRMSSGSYFPKPVRTVLIPKENGGERSLGIPTIDDRIAQTVFSLLMEPVLEPRFSDNSFGFRPGRSAHDAVKRASDNGRTYGYVIDLDIEKFFDNVDHDLLLRAVKKHATEPWMMLYVKRWLESPSQNEDGSVTARERGTPQGGVASPLLANLFLHYAFDAWMEKTIPTLPFERYVDDIIVHCKSRKQAEHVQKLIKQRLESCGLRMHPTKTKIVFCKNQWRQDTSGPVTFDFLGFTFQPRVCLTSHGLITGFCPAISLRAQKRIRAECKSWQLHNQVFASLDEIAKKINPVIRGWYNYYSKFYRSLCLKALDYIDTQLVKWLRRKYLRYAKNKTRASRALTAIRERNSRLFAHWEARGVCKT